MVKVIAFMGKAPIGQGCWLWDGSLDWPRSLLSFPFTRGGSRAFPETCALPSFFSPWIQLFCAR
jgi:hypothetical protein